MTDAERAVFEAAERLNKFNVEVAQVNVMPGFLYRDVMAPLSRRLDEAFQEYYESHNALTKS